MFDDFPVVSDYGKLSAQFHSGRSRLIETIWWKLRRFLNFLFEQLLNV